MLSEYERDDSTDTSSSSESEIEIEINKRAVTADEWEKLPGIAWKIVGGRLAVEGDNSKFCMLWLIEDVL